ncbi:MAG: methylmalonyl Co-A mutase-associated GTPase MeaB [Candidatus Nealsonbacteria bacterium]|nr:methylmalonyl Co-A mutase-associated GTPase MeaB [Candidatus Nealsonbacteria bacterium]
MNNSSQKTKDLLNRAVSGNSAAGARLMTMAENNNRALLKLLKELNMPAALVLGITGAGGSGKSTLVNKIVGLLRKKGKRVGVILCDPTSSQSGGAILADRIQLVDHLPDNHVFIRSMATRESLGGIPETLPWIIKIMKLMGFDIILVETIGVGQDQTLIERMVDLVIVVVGYGYGDDIQLIKSSVLESGDIIVVNQRASWTGDKAISDLKFLFNNADEKKKILALDAANGKGVDELIEEIMPK